ncbi:MAG: PASTA domain-containing protein, partial [Jatrophihabitantaceae bacterium]
PTAYTFVAPQSVVILKVSTGKVRLPNVEGKKAAVAKSLLNSANWTNVDTSKTVETPDKAKDGTVADESPTPGFPYAQSTPIILTIYKYKAPAPTCTTPPPTPPPITPTTPFTPPVFSTTPGTPTPTPTTAGGLPPCTS